MTYALKSMLLSGLGYPGLGQMFLKHYLRGLVFLLAATVGLGAVVVEASRMMLSILANIDLSRGDAGPGQIFRWSHQAVTDASGIHFKIAIALILFSWIIGTVDAYLLGRRRDHAAPEDSITPNQDFS